MDHLWPGVGQTALSDGQVLSIKTLSPVHPPAPSRLSPGPAGSLDSTTLSSSAEWTRVRRIQDGTIPAYSSAPRHTVVSNLTRARHTHTHTHKTDLVLAQNHRPETDSVAKTIPLLIRINRMALVVNLFLHLNLCRRSRRRSRR